MKSFPIREYIGITVLIAVSVVSSLVFKETIIDFTGVSHVFLSLAISVVPALLWLYFFYMQDKYEKEPIEILFGTYLLGAIVAFAICYQIQDIFRESLESQTGFMALIQSVLVIGALQELVKFLVLRYTIYHSVEFNEPADGMIYGAAIGLGFATAYNVVYLNSLDSINLGVVIVRVIEFYLIHAAFTGVMGYFFGRAKFIADKKKQEKLVLAGFVIAVLLNGSYDFITGLFRDAEFNQWKSIITSSVFVFIVFILLNTLLTTLVENSPFKEDNNN